MQVFTCGPSAKGQGTPIFDQESSTDETPFANAGVQIQQASPFGQSFTPTLSTIGFIRLNLNDYDSLNGQGAALHLNLRTNSVSGPGLATTSSVTLTNGFVGIVHFFFGSNIPVSAGTTYAFQIEVDSGDLWNAVASEYNYPGGTIFANGLPVGGMGDVWFREGIIVPEPTSAALFVGGTLAILFGRRVRIWKK